MWEDMKGDKRAEKIKKSFDERTYQKGSDYFKEGRVIDLVVDRNRVMGQVVGRSDRPYNVTLVWGKHIRSSCSCPVGDMCKHGAAVALAFISDDIERIDLERARKAIGRLDEKEAKGVLSDCMALEPQLALLLPIGNDGSRVERALDRLDKSIACEIWFGLPRSLYDGVDLIIRSAGRWVEKGRTWIECG